MSKRKVLAVRYHRNGMSGDGFYSVRFTDSEAASCWDLPKDSQLVAVLPAVYVSDDPEQHKFACEVECYVIALNEPELSWRGDHFADWAVPICRAASEDMSAHRCERSAAKIAERMSKL